MQQPGPPPAEMGMTPLGGQGTAPPNVPQGRNDENSCLIHYYFFLLANPTYPQQPMPGYVAPTPYGMPTGQFDGHPNMTTPYSPQGVHFNHQSYLITINNCSISRSARYAFSLCSSR